MDKIIGGKSFLLVLVVALDGRPGATDKGRGSSWVLSLAFCSAQERTSDLAFAALRPRKR